MVKFSSPGVHLEKPEIVNPGKSSWKSPSNIAIVKYWGKYGNQLPRNPSISLTLSEAVTQTAVSYSPKKKKSLALDVELIFEGKRNVSFEEKIKERFEKLLLIFPYLNQLSFKVESKNSFPHSSGIASSASSMSALALCLCEIENKLFGNLNDREDFFRKASFVARICSGSASRSVFPFVGLWGKTEAIEHSSDYFAIDIHEEVHPIFQTFHDDILIVSKDEKSVSSSAGHKLMDTNVFAGQRYLQAKQHVNDLYRIMKAGDIEAFGHLAESEALTLHALMMCSTPSYLLMRTGSLEIIEKIRTFREDTKLPVYFSLDAGPNIHTLYPSEIKDEVQKFIKEELQSFCEDGKIIFDQVGEGPIQL